MKLLHMFAALKLYPMVTLLLVALFHAAVPALAAGDKPQANSCCSTLNHQCIKSNLCAVYDCVCSSDIDNVLLFDAGKSKVKDGKAAFMSPRNIGSPAAKKLGMAKKGMRAMQL